MKKVYQNVQHPRKYDGTHYLVYLNAQPAEYVAYEDAEPVDGIEYEGPIADGGTLIECDEWNRDKLINALIRTRYLQTEEDAIKTHQIQLLHANSGIEGGTLPDDKVAEYTREWKDFQAFRQYAIDIVNSWDEWE